MVGFLESADEGAAAEFLANKRTAASADDDVKWDDDSEDEDEEDDDDDETKAVEKTAVEQTASASKSKESNAKDTGSNESFSSESEDDDDTDTDGESRTGAPPVNRPRPASSPKTAQSSGNKLETAVAQARRSDEKSQADSEASYDVVGAASGAPSRQSRSPTGNKRRDDSDESEDDWE